MRWTIEDHFTGCTLEQYIEMYYSQAYSDAMATAIGLKERRLVESTEQPDGKIFRRVHIVPNVPVPKTFTKILGGREIAYDEVSTFDPETHSAEFKIEHAGPDRLEHKGVYRFFETEKGVRRVMENECNVGIPLVGGKAEKLVAAEVKKSFVKVAEFTQSYIDTIHPS